MRGQTEGSHEEINVEEAIRIHGNMVYRLALVQYKKESCSQDSPPAAGRFSDVLLFRRSALLHGAFFMLWNITE